MSVKSVSQGRSNRYIYQLCGSCSRGAVPGGPTLGVDSLLTDSQSPNPELNCALSALALSFLFFLFVFALSSVYFALWGAVVS